MSVNPFHFTAVSGDINRRFDAVSRLMVAIHVPSTSAFVAYWEKNHEEAYYPIIVSKIVFSDAVAWRVRNDTSLHTHTHTNIYIVEFLHGFTVKFMLMEGMHGAGGHKTV